MKVKEVAFHTLFFICSLTKTLRPKEEMTVSQWADKNMVLPDGSNEAGHFRTANVPYQKEIMDAITDIHVRSVTIMSSSQVGKTTIILCGIGYYIEHEPAMQQVVLPTLSLGEKFSKTRLAHMIRDIPSLRKKIAPAKAKDSDNTILFKQYAGGYIIVSGANSPASLSSMPIRIVWMDEVDRYPESAGGEGDPVKLAEKRATTFWNKKFIKTSSPTIAGESKIEEEYLDGTMEEWCVKCPCCGEWQPYDFERVNFEHVAMVCTGCGEIVPENDWKQSEHKWIAEHPERKKHRSFHLNELASPWVEWRDIINEYLKAYNEYKKLHDTSKLQVFINTALGLPWQAGMAGKDDITEKVLKERAEHYEADIPDGVLLLTAAVDVQDNRFEIEVRGWTRDYETWGIYKTEIYGNLETKEPWEELEKYLETTFFFKNGLGLNIAATAIDTGGSHTTRVYKWVKYMKEKRKRIYGIKGYEGKEKTDLIHKRSTASIKEKGRNGKDIVVGTTELIILGVSSGKEDIRNRLKIQTPGEGYCHFPSNKGRGYDIKYYEGLLSEVKVVKKVRGIKKETWVKKSGVRNEPLDLFNYNYAACELLRPVWGALEEKIKQGVNYMKMPGKKKRPRRSQSGMEA